LGLFLNVCVCACRMVEVGVGRGGRSREEGVGKEWSVVRHALTQTSAWLSRFGT